MLSAQVQYVDGSASGSSHGVNGLHLSTTAVSPVTVSVRTILYVGRGLSSTVHGSTLLQLTITPSSNLPAVVLNAEMAPGRSAIFSVISSGAAALPLASTERTAYR